MADIRQILSAFAEGRASLDETQRAIESLGIGYADLGDAKVDLHRRQRRGVAEAVFCGNKTADQVARIAERMDAAGQNVVCTRVSAELAAELEPKLAGFTYHSLARVLAKQNEPHKGTSGTILVISAGTSDLPVAEEAAVCAELMGNSVERIHDCGVAGIHRLFGAARDKMAHARVIIVVAGMEGALPSVVAGLVSAPVIAVPTSVGYGAAFGGIAALLGMLNACSGGIAVVNIDNGFGAALMAHLINQTGEAAAAEVSHKPFPHPQDESDHCIF